MLTALPPPCGTSEIDKILTPMVAQSSVEASLITMATVPFCGPAPSEALEFELLQPATNTGAAANSKARVRRRLLKFICVLLQKCKGRLIPSRRAGLGATLGV